MARMDEASLFQDESVDPSSLVEVLEQRTKELVEDRNETLRQLSVADGHMTELQKEVWALRNEIEERDLASATGFDLFVSPASSVCGLPTPSKDEVIAAVKDCFNKLKAWTSENLVENWDPVDRESLADTLDVLCKPICDAETATSLLTFGHTYRRYLVEASINNFLMPFFTIAWFKHFTPTMKTTLDAVQRHIDHARPHDHAALDSQLSWRATLFSRLLHRAETQQRIKEDVVRTCQNLWVMLQPLLKCSGTSSESAYSSLRGVTDAYIVAGGLMAISPIEWSYQMAQPNDRWEPYCSQPRHDPQKNQPVIFEDSGFKFKTWFGVFPSILIGDFSEGGQGIKEVIQREVVLKPNLKVRAKKGPWSTLAGTEQNGTGQ